MPTSSRKIQIKIWVRFFILHIVPLFSCRRNICKQMVADPYRKMVHVFFYVNFSNAKSRTENVTTFSVLIFYS